MGLLRGLRERAQVDILRQVRASQARNASNRKIVEKRANYDARHPGRRKIGWNGQKQLHEDVDATGLQRSLYHFKPQVYTICIISSHRTWGDHPTKIYTQCLNLAENAQNTQHNQPELIHACTISLG